MKAALTLSKSSLTVPTDNAERIMDALGVHRNRYASHDQVENLVRAHNRPGGRHLLDIGKPAKRSFARAYGRSLGFILGDYNADGEAVEYIAQQAGRNLRLFFDCCRDSGVIVKERSQDEYGVHLQPKAMCGDPNRLLEEDYTLLVPTGVTSPLIGHEMLYERIDLCKSHAAGIDFAVKEVLFTGEDGESIAGTGDIDGLFIERRHDLLPAIYAVLKDDYDLLDINRRIFSAVQRHFYYAPGEEEIEVPIAADLTVVFDHASGRNWKVLFYVCGRCRTMEEFAPKNKYSIDAKATLAAQRRLTDAFKELPDLNGRVDLDTVFSDHRLTRFPPAFREEYANDPEAAKSKFVTKLNESLERFRSNPRHWHLIPFSNGNEKRLVLNGESTDAAIQLCAPVYLTEMDERIKRASVYAVAEFRFDPEISKYCCNVPSILDNRMGTSDMGHIISGVRRDLCAA